MSDLISRQAALDAIDEVLMEDEQYKVWFKLSIKNLPSAQKWIPCKDRFPEMYDRELLGDYDNSDTCIVTAIVNGRAMVCESSVVYCSDGEWRYLDSEAEPHLFVDEVIAWMPLPDPWKGADNEID